jgi:Cys-tRNA(Pro)/Cys-tRNA(Cys) deacylase
MNKIKEIKNLIKEKNIDVEIIEHEKSGLTSQDAANATGIPIENIVKTLLFIDKKKKPVVVICLGNDYIDSKKLSEIAEIKKPKIATPEELKEILGTIPGGNPPIGIPQKIPVFIDKKVLNKDFVLGSAGSEFTGLKIKPKDILELSNAKIVGVVKNG